MTVLPPPGNRAGHAGYELLLPDQLNGTPIITTVKRGDGEHPQRHPLGGRVAELPGHGQRAAAVLGPFGQPTQVQQYRRPAAQGIGQHPGRPPVPGGVSDCGEMVQRPGPIGRAVRSPAQPVLDGAPPVAARLGEPGYLGQ
jgi:hypothetical protein